MVGSVRSLSSVEEIDESGEQLSLFGNEPPSVAKFVSTSDEPSVQDRDDWMAAMDEPIPPGIPQILRDRIIDNRAMSQNVLESARESRRSFRGIRDTAGNLQAGAIVRSARDHIFIAFFSTAPWNILRNSSRSVRGAGEALMAQIVRESIDRGHGGETRLGSLSGAISFYEGVGFVTNEENDEMILTRERAIRFLQRMES